MISLLPRKEFTLDTSLNSDELRTAIKRLVRDKQFGGNVSETNFRISISIPYRNDFKPQLTGVFDDAEEFKVSFRLNAVARGILTVFLSLTAIAMVVTLMIIPNTEQLSFNQFIPMVMFFGTLAGSHLGFWMEVPRTKKYFEEAVVRKLERLTK